MADEIDEVGKRLINTTDAVVWAEEFCRIFDGKFVNTDVGQDVMLTWFANAIETGRNAGRKELCPHEFHQLGDDLWACTDCGTVTSDAPPMTNEEAFLEGFQEGRD
jgi:hypothetical protein